MTPTPSLPYQRARAALVAAALVLTLGSACKDPAGRVPKEHRAEAVACNTAPIAGNVEGVDAGAGTAPPECASDPDCTEGLGGRCSIDFGTRDEPGARCVYDACYEDGDCGARSACVCSGTVTTGNRCLPGNCAIDADCSGGLCSPSLGDCGAFGGTVGNFCHLDADECTNDDECTEQPGGYCAWSPEVERWRCAYGQCVG